MNSGRGIVETVLKIGRCALGGPLQQNSTLPNWGCMRCYIYNGIKIGNSVFYAGCPIFSYTVTYSCHLSCWKCQ